MAEAEKKFRTPKEIEEDTKEKLEADAKEHEKVVKELDKENEAAKKAQEKDEKDQKAAQERAEKETAGGTSAKR